MPRALAPQIISSSPYPYQVRESDHTSHSEKWPAHSVRGRTEKGQPESYPEERCGHAHRRQELSFNAQIQASGTCISRQPRVELFHPTARDRGLTARQVSPGSLRECGRAEGGGQPPTPTAFAEHKGGGCHQVWEWRPVVSLHGHSLPRTSRKFLPPLCFRSFIYKIGTREGHSSEPQPAPQSHDKGDLSKATAMTTWVRNHQGVWDFWLRPQRHLVLTQSFAGPNPLVSSRWDPCYLPNRSGATLLPKPPSLTPPYLAFETQTLSPERLVLETVPEVPPSSLSFPHFKMR